MLGGPAAVLAQDPGGVGVVDHEHGCVPAAELDQVGQRRDRAFHGEDAVGDHHSRPPVARRPELFLEIGEVGVPVDRRLTLGDRLREPGRVDDRRMVQLVADHDVLFAEQGGGNRLVGVPRAHEAERGGGAHQPGARGLEHPVDGVRAADEPHRGGAGAPAPERRLPGCHHLGLVAQAEVIVRREDDDLAPALHPDPGPLRAVEVVEALVDAVANELLQLALEPLLE